MKKLLAIVAMGLVNLYSATQVAPKGLFGTQLFFYGVGVVLVVIAAALVGLAVNDSSVAVPTTMHWVARQDDRCSADRSRY